MNDGLCKQKCGGLGAWPQLLGSLNAMLSSSDPAQIDGAFDGLQKLFEDLDSLEDDASGSAQALQQLIPQFLR